MIDMDAMIDSISDPLASRCYKHIIEEISAFEKNLDNEHEVAIKLANFGGSVLLYVDNIGYINPDLITMSGISNTPTAKGAYSKLIIHMNQLSFMLVAVKKQNPSKPARRIGFC